MFAPHALPKRPLLLLWCRSWRIAISAYEAVAPLSQVGLEQAKAAAGAKDVGIWGGAKIIQQYLKAGLLDEMQIHLIPVLLGHGVRLFEDLGPERIELKATRTIQTPAARHLRFTVAQPGSHHRET